VRSAAGPRTDALIVRAAVIVLTLLVGAFPKDYAAAHALEARPDASAIPPRSGSSSSSRLDGHDAAAGCLPGRQRLAVPTITSAPDRETSVIIFFT